MPPFERLPKGEYRNNIEYRKMKCKSSYTSWNWKGALNFLFCLNCWMLVTARILWFTPVKSEIKHIPELDTFPHK